MATNSPKPLSQVLGCTRFVSGDLRVRRSHMYYGAQQPYICPICHELRPICHELHPVQRQRRPLCLHWLCTCRGDLRKGTLVPTDLWPNLLRFATSCSIALRSCKQLVQNQIFRPRKMCEGLRLQSDSLPFLLPFLCEFFRAISQNPEEQNGRWRTTPPWSHTCGGWPRPPRRVLERHSARASLLASMQAPTVLGCCASS